MDMEEENPSMDDRRADGVDLVLPDDVTQEMGSDTKDTLTAGLDAKGVEVLRGVMTDLPPLPSNTIRIFLSSTFSDFKAERNFLPRQAYPTLQTYCSDLGLDFQVVDMRWGVTDDVINDHQVSDLCIQEIITCQQVSCGPNFVMFLGNRYGWQPFPVKIDAVLFQAFTELAADNDIQERHLLDKWFLRDDNAVPAQYVLQPIHYQFKSYTVVGEESSVERVKDRAEWNVIFAKLRTILRQCATCAYEAGVISNQQRKQFYLSVTEEEIHQGVFCAENPDQKVLCYIRELENIDSDTENVATHLYMDVDEEGNIDSFAKTMRREIAEKQVPAALNDRNIHKYKVEWKGQFLEDSQDSDHLGYLETFSEHFIEDMKLLIDRAAEELNEDEDHQMIQALYYEVLHHAKFASTKLKSFCGRKDELERIKKHLLSADAPNSPLVVYGRSGIGKTALLAAAASNVHTWMGKSTVVILRHLGTSPQSSNISDVMKTAILQICINFKYPLPKEENLENFGDLRRQFWTILDQASKDDPSSRIVLIVDAVDQLQVTYGAHKMIWLPKVMPRNVFLIVSTLQDSRFSCLDNTRKRFPDLSFFLELKDISEETGEQIIDFHLELSKRQLTSVQKDLVLKAFHQNRQPLFLKLAMDSAKTWNSYTPLSSIQISTSVHDAITMLFESLEVKYGRVFVRHALGYLTSGWGGLSDIEMEDALSCDDQVLNDVYQYHDPPVEGIVRIPSLLWARLQYALKEYLVDRQVDGKVVRNWYHRQFWETAEQRYVNTQEEKEFLHGILADIFLQEHGIKRTIELKQRDGKVIEDANRCVTPQPLSARNRRKLNCIPHHLLHAGRIYELQEKCLLKFDWLLIKLLSFNIGFLVKEFARICESDAIKDYPDIQVFSDFLELCFDALWQDPFLLAYNIIERLGKCRKKSNLMVRCIEDAQMWVTNTHIPILIPTHKIGLAPPDSPLRFNILVGYNGKLSSDGNMIACSWLERSGVAKIQVLNLQTKHIIASITTDKAYPYQLTSDNRHFMYCDANYLHVCEMDGGEQVKGFRYQESEYEKVNIRCLALSQDCHFVAMCAKLGKPKNQHKKAKGWKTETWLYMLDIHQQKTIAKEMVHFRKSMDIMFFVSGDSKLLAISKDQILIYEINNLDLLHTSGHTEMYPEMAKLCINTLAVPVKKNQSTIKLLLFNHETGECKESEILHSSSEPRISPYPFSIQVKEDGSAYAIGVTTPGKAPLIEPDSSICVWNLANNTYNWIKLASKGLKCPSVMALTKNWEYAFLGWNGGHLTLVDMIQHKEFFTVQSHGQAINFIAMVNNDAHAITLAQDHSLKVWDVNCSIELALNQAEGKREIKLQRSIAICEIPTLDITEQCLDLAVTSQFVVSAPPDSAQGPRLWYVSNGELLEDISERFRQLYQSSCKDSLIDMETKTHAEIHALEDDVLVYVRKRRDGLTLFVTKGHHSPLVCAHRDFTDTFFALIPQYGIMQKAEGGVDTDQKLILVKDNLVEIYTLPGLEKDSEIAIPAISDDVRNIASSGGKRRLFNYKVGITYDGRYFLIVNPGGTYGSPTVKYFDIIDVKEKKYVSRVQMTRYTPMTLMSDSVTFLCLTDESNAAIYRPSMLCNSENLDSFSYKCPIYTSKFVSYDGSLGVEFVHRNHTVNIWQLHPLPVKLHTFVGHVHQVTSCDISHDNRYLVTGSYDKTVRVWSITEGKQSCMFHVNGSVDNVLFSPSDQFVIVNSYAAPQKKRGIVLKLQNVKNRRKFARYMSRYDIM